jgi:tripartite-type tricarboxylate transporter receptor subunit TctC
MIYRNTLRNTALAFGLALMANTALAQSYPDRPIRWIVPSAPGDGSDTTARLIGAMVAKELGQSIVVENRPGAGGVIGSESAATSQPNGYTMIVGNAGSHAINAAIYSKLRYDVVEDFEPVALFCTAPNVMVVSPAVKANTVAEFAEYAKANPDMLNYASGGVGSSAHMSAELFKSTTGTKLTHIPYKGSGPAIMAIISDEAQVMIGNLPPWLTQIKAGKAKALAVTSAQRIDSLPDVPAMSEFYPGFETEAWFGLFAPKGTPKPLVEQMNAVVNKVLAAPAVKEKLAGLSCAPAPTSPEAFRDRLRSEVIRWKELAARNHITVD